MAGIPVIVNGEPIQEAEIRAEVAAQRKDLEGRGIELDLERRMGLRDRAIAHLIERLLIFQECRRLGLMPSAREIEDLANTLVPRVDGVSGCRAGTDLSEVTREAGRRLTFAHIIAHWCRNIKPPKSTEVRDYYRAHQDQFWRPETVHAAHLVRNKESRVIEETRAEMESVRQRLLSGEDFAALAATCSDCLENGGDLGFFARGVMVEEFDAVVFNAPLHEVTPVFETRFGLHVAVVHERRPAGLMELTEVGGQIAEALLRGKQDQEVGRQLEALRRRAVVQVSGM
jgi:hypothetical protein